MHYKTSESTSTSYTQVIHDGDGEITRTPFFRDVLRLPVRFKIWELAAGVSEGRHTHKGESALEELYYPTFPRSAAWERRNPVRVLPI